MNDVFVFLKIGVWIVLFIIGIQIALTMVSAASTVQNIIGFILLIMILVISEKTKCLTTIKLKKNEK